MYLYNCRYDSCPPPKRAQRHQQSTHQHARAASVQLHRGNATAHHRRARSRCDDRDSIDEEAGEAKGSRCSYHARAVIKEAAAVFKRLVPKVIWRSREHKLEPSQVAKPAMRTVLF